MNVSKEDDATTAVALAIDRFGKFDPTLNAERSDLLNEQRRISRISLCRPDGARMRFARMEALIGVRLKDGRDFGRESYASGSTNSWSDAPSIMYREARPSLRKLFY